MMRRKKKSDFHFNSVLFTLDFFVWPQSLKREIEIDRSKFAPGKKWASGPKTSFLKCKPDFHRKCE